MCPRPHAGSRQDIELKSCLDSRTCSTRARVAHGGVGKSSKLFFSSARCAITACEVFCMCSTTPDVEFVLHLFYLFVKGTMGRFGRPVRNFDHQSQVFRQEIPSGCIGGSLHTRAATDRVPIPAEMH